MTKLLHTGSPSRLLEFFMALLIVNREKDFHIHLTKGAQDHKNDKYFNLRLFISHFKW